MPAEFQRVMDCIPSEFPQAHAFIHHILVVTKGTEIDHIATVEKVLKKLDEENMYLKLTQMTMRICVVRPQKKNTHGNNIISAKNRTNGSAETAADSNSIEIVYGVNTQPPQVFASAGRY